jgi:hypothetical protein
LARRVFFSFHYNRDVRRVVQVRNSWVVRARGEAQPFLDSASWESIKRRGDPAVERWIEEQLAGTSVTVVLIGAETFQSKWVKYEIRRSCELGKGMFGIYIHNLKDPQVGTDSMGRNPFDHWSIKQNGRDTVFSSLYRTYDWVADDGYTNIGSWIEAAAPRPGGR